ncbi:MAG: hypothetical protein ACOH5I_03235 [Oligoflexus sp.]
MQLTGSKIFRNHQNQLGVVQQIGTLMAEVHTLPVSNLEDLQPGWKVFIDQQFAACQQRHHSHGMPDWFLAELDAWLGEARALLPLLKTYPI